MSPGGHSRRRGIRGYASRSAPAANPVQAAPYGTVVRATDGLEAAQVLLGHSKADVTQIYAERDTERAKSVALKIG